MSKAYKCDRCGGYFDDTSQACHIETRLVYRASPCIRDIDGDLCPGCRDELFSWYDEIRNAAKKEHPLTECKA